MQITDQLPLVVIESPYKGDVARNEAFARALLRWAIDHGYSPFAMHLLYTQVLDDLVPAERAAGISCGLSWTRQSNEVWYCLRPEDEVSSGMQLAIDRDQRRTAAGEPVRVRHLRFSQEGVLLGGWEGPLPQRVFGHGPEAAPGAVHAEVAALKAGGTNAAPAAPAAPPSRPQPRVRGAAVR